MLQLKVHKFGDSLGVLLPEEAISRLNVREGTALYLIEAPEGGYRLLPYDPEVADRVGGIISRYRDALRHLSK